MSPKEVKVSTSTEVAVPEAVIPPALAGPNAHAALYRHLRTESRLAWLPTGTAAVSGGVDLWLHELMVNAIHTNVWAAPLAIAIGAATNGASTLVTTWVLARKGAADGLVLKRVGWGSVAAGAVMTLVGTAWPVADLVYPVLAAIGTWEWHRTRRRVRKALRKALLATNDTTPMPAPAPEPVPIGDLVDLVGRWARGVAPNVVQGSTAINPQRHAEGRISFIIDGGDKGIVLDDVQGKKKQIVGGLHLELPDEKGRGGQDIVFDQPGGMGLHSGQVRAQIINLASSTARSAYVVKEMETQPGNPWSFRLGRYVDNGEPAYYDLADYIGAHSSAIVAGTGMGKSSLVDHIAYRARQLGFHILYIDPTDGTSSPIMSKYATWKALGKDKAPAALWFAQALAANRRQWFKMHLHAGIEAITPGMIAPCAPNGTHPNPTCPCKGVVPPGVLAIVEECDLIFSEKMPGSSTLYGVPWGDLAKAIRKLLMGMVAVTQIQEVKAFGSDEKLRSSLTTRNFIAGHTSTNQGGNLIPGLPYSPKLIPKQNGRALMCGQTTRKMEIMLDWMPRRVRADVAPDCPAYAEDLYDALPDLPIWPMDAAAAEKHLPSDTAGTVDPVDAAALRRFAAIMAGETPPPELAPAAASPAAPAAPMGLAAEHNSETVLSVGDDPWHAGVTAVCRPPSLAERQPGAASAPAQPLSDDTRAVLAALAEHAELLAGGEEWVPSETVLAAVATVTGWPVNTEGGRLLAAALRAVGVESDRPSIGGRKVTSYRRWDLRRAVRTHHNVNAA